MKDHCIIPAGLHKTYTTYCVPVVNSFDHIDTKALPYKFYHNNCMCTKYVTGPVKTGHMGTNYTPSHYWSYLSTGIEYLHSETCIVMSIIKCLLRVENFIAMA